MVTPMDSSFAVTLFPYHLPGEVLLYLLSAADRSLRIVSDNGTDDNLIHVQTESQAVDSTLTAFTLQDWYFDPRTGLPSRVDYVLPGSASSNSNGTASIVFLSWQKTPASLVPQSIQLSVKRHNYRDRKSSGLLSTTFGLTTAIFQLP